MRDFSTLRKQYPLFIFKGYNIATTNNYHTITYHFCIDGLVDFNPTWVIPTAKNMPFDNLVFNLGMAELISYWKITCSPNVRIDCDQTLTDEQIKWWKKLYFYGLGEFFYLNDIDTDIESFMCINVANSDAEISEVNIIKPNEHENDNATPSVLIPIGGGKDSAVTLEHLKNKLSQINATADSNNPGSSDVPPNLYTYIINPRGATLNTLKAGKIPHTQAIIATRTLDSTMLKLNAQGYLNGHTPFSSIVAFSSVLVSQIYGLNYVALSNENSANEPTVKGQNVNHQYSKSFEFEHDFYIYNTKFLRSNVHYFSYLRPYTEYKIAQMFAQLPREYHKIFRSCNAGSKQDKWCCNCPKCLFVYIILSPFLKQDYLTKIFGENLLNKANLREDFLKLIGSVTEKPFECVGSREEVNFALCQAIKNGYIGELIDYYKTTNEYAQYKDRNNDLLERYSKENLIPKILKE
ncbi:MAG: hypothetical protein LBM38_04765 [Clostridiales bacterium]|nr:hypothetical protein [Clostridiales bacterium]